MPGGKQGRQVFMKSLEKIKEIGNLGDYPRGLMVS